MKEIKRMQIRLPADLHEWLRNTAFKDHTSMNKMIIESLEKTRESERKREK